MPQMEKKRHYVSFPDTRYNSLTEMIQERILNCNDISQFTDIILRLVHGLIIEAVLSWKYSL